MRFRKGSEDYENRSYLSVRVYRGSNLNRAEIELLRVNTLVATNGFFSSSMDLKVARLFAGIDPITGVRINPSRQNNREAIIFEIDVDLIHSPEIIVADVSKISAIPGEIEVLFSLGTTFVITGIKHEEAHSVWYIRMISSSEVAKISQEHHVYIQKRLVDVNATLLFGHFLAEIWSDYQEPCHTIIVYCAIQPQMMKIVQTYTIILLACTATWVNTNKPSHIFNVLGYYNGVKLLGGVSTMVAHWPVWVQFILKWAIMQSYKSPYASDQHSPTTFVRRSYWNGYALQ